MIPREVVLTLSGIPGLGAAKIKMLLDHFDDPADLSGADLHSLCAVEGVDRKSALSIFSAFRDVKKRSGGWGVRGNAGRVGSVPHSCRWLEVTLVDPEYPPILKNIYDPPPLLYMDGDGPTNLTRTLAIVGTRKPSPYGRRITRQLGEFCADAGITTVSGLARGIDSEVHRATLDAGGRTVGVLGCGIDVIYPRENGKLYESVRKSGWIVTEFPPGTPPLRPHFPARNRIISGMSQGVVVIEAGRKGGALITASFGLEQGKTIFALPGHVDEEVATGTNRLLADGAIPLLSFSDVLDEIIEFRDVTAPPDPSRHAFGSPRTPSRSVSVNREEKLVLELLDDGKKHFNDLCHMTSYRVEELNGHLFSLEMNRLVRRLPGNFYARD